MKKFKISFILVIIFSTIFISSCTKEEESNIDISQNSKVSAYLKSFYKKNYKLGASVEAKFKPENSSLARTAEFENIIVTEVFVENETRARGYVLTNKTTNIFLYFVDVDRIEYKTTKVDIEANQTEIVEDIEQLESYLSTNQFDLIEVTQDLMNESGQAGALGRIRYSYGSCVNGRRGVYQATFFLGIQWTDWSAVQEPNSSGTGMTNATVGCNELYRLDRTISAD